MYEWVSGITVGGDIYIKGTPTETFLFKSTGIITFGNGVCVILKNSYGGIDANVALAKNIV